MKRERRPSWTPYPQADVIIIRSRRRGRVLSVANDHALVELEDGSHDVVPAAGVQPADYTELYRGPERTTDGRKQ